jgi:hypothetical protein
MNPFLMTLLAIFFRQAVLMLAGAMGIGPVVHAFIDAHMSEWNQFALGVAAAFVTVVYAGYKAFEKRRILLTALASPVPMSEVEAKAQVKDPNVITPSVTTPKNEVPDAATAR